MKKILILMCSVAVMMSGCSTLGGDKVSASDAIKLAEAAELAQAAGLSDFDGLSNADKLLVAAKLADTSDLSGLSGSSASAIASSARSAATIAAPNSNDVLYAQLIANLSSQAGGDSTVRSQSDAACSRIYENHAALMGQAAVAAPGAESGDEAEEGKGGLLKIAQGAMTGAGAVFGVAGAFSGGSTVGTMTAASGAMNGISNLTGMFAESKDEAAAAAEPAPINVTQIALTRAFQLNCPVGPLAP